MKNTLQNAVCLLVMFVGQFALLVSARAADLYVHLDVRHSNPHDPDSWGVWSVDVYQNLELYQRGQAELSAMSVRLRGIHQAIVSPLAGSYADSHQEFSLGWGCGPFQQCDAPYGWSPLQRTTRSTHDELAAFMPAAPPPLAGLVVGGTAVWLSAGRPPALVLSAATIVRGYFL